MAQGRAIVLEEVQRREERPLSDLVVRLGIGCVRVVAAGVASGGGVRDLQLLQDRLEVLYVFLCFSHLRVAFLDNGRVVGLLPHVGGSLCQLLLPVDLLQDVIQLVLVIVVVRGHGGTLARSPAYREGAGETKKRKVDVKVNRSPGKRVCLMQAGSCRGNW